jgi:4-hydroxy-3-methylbut-2-enyl diphosphate reductase
VSGLLIAAPWRLEAFVISRERPPARVRHTGIGPRRARAAVPALLGDPAEALLVLGFGGGLVEDSEVGEVVVADEVVGPDGARVPCADATPLAGALESSGLVVRRGAVSSVTRPAMGGARLRLREAGAVAVDMESAWLAAAARGRPFNVVRVLSDTPRRELTRPLRSVVGIARASTALREVASALHGWVP